MKKLSAVMWGLALIAVGVILGGNALGLFNIDLFFKGWWTLFIIVPCFIGLITNRDGWVGHLIGLLVGVSLLLACLDVIGFEMLWKLLLPGIVIIIGLSMIMKTCLATNSTKPFLNFALSTTTMTKPALSLAVLISI